MFNKLFLVLTLTTLIITISCKNNPTDSDNVAPTASFTINPTSGTNLTVFTFDASGSSDNEDETSVLQVRWDWNNDGTFDTDYSTNKTGTHQYTVAGTYTILLEVKDSEGLTYTTTKIVIVQRPNIVVTFSDANFEHLIRSILNKLGGGDITDIELETITELNGKNWNISDISGIEYCTNLVRLDLRENQIIDISALNGLVKLEILSLMFNQIVDISSLSGLTQLQVLSLEDNQVVDISALSGLTNLILLFLENNQVVDINALSGLTNLSELGLAGNQIIDIYPLILNNGIDNGDVVFLTNNPLNTTSINTYIPQLEARGVTVIY